MKIITLNCGKDDIKKICSNENTEIYKTVYLLNVFGCVLHFLPTSYKEPNIIFGVCAKLKITPFLLFYHHHCHPCLSLSVSLVIAIVLNCFLKTDEKQPATNIVCLHGLLSFHSGPFLHFSLVHTICFRLMSFCFFFKFDN